MTFTDPCPGCGYLRRVVDRTPTSVTWFCRVCRQHALETFTPTPFCQKDRP